MGCHMVGYDSAPPLQRSRAINSFESRSRPLPRPRLIQACGITVPRHAAAKRATEATDRQEHVRLLDTKLTAKPQRETASATLPTALARILL